ncbi:hypothetical protein QJS10_CPB19g01551 [Acorus calamus]|uniref:Uncharacterized protein n=1 Tax=Acorus calamus TaxID=4465 RepID=A0AAV9CDP3_ACOCL|nr:hypothetical protein QJS10_CPB19g01551 [Acorus calamus]
MRRVTREGMMRYGLRKRRLMRETERSMERMRKKKRARWERNEHEVGHRWMRPQPSLALHVTHPMQLAGTNSTKPLSKYQLIHVYHTGLQMARKKKNKRLPIRRC